MEDLLLVTICSTPGEAERAFKTRLTEFWTHMIRQHPEAYEKVFAEQTQFQLQAGQLARGYLIESDGVDAVTAQLKQAGLSFQPLDRDDTYSRYEAASPEWYQLNHD